MTTTQPTPTTPPPNGGPAFPIPTIVGIHGQLHDIAAVGGMSLRDWYAGKEQLNDYDNDRERPTIPAAEALAGRMMPKRADYQSSEEWGLACWEWEADWRAKLRYIRADAMLRAGGHAT